MNFMDDLYNKAKSDIKTIVLPESEDIRTLKAASMILEKGIANIILIDKDNNIKSLKNENYDISKAKIVNPDKFEKFEEYVNEFYKMRKSKGITMQLSREMLKNPLYLGVMMVKIGEADGMVAGANNSTSNTLRPALQIIKTRPDANLVSGFFIIAVPDCTYGHNGVFIFSDSGLIENPNAEELADIAITSAKSFEALFGEKAKVALLSYSTYGSAKSILTQKVVNATMIAKKRAPEMLIDGEMQLDAAIVESIGRKKCPDSIMAGKANVLIFPDLNSGNIVYKAAQRFAKADAIGLITQGLAKPVNDMSRGCSAEDIVGVAAITAVQAQTCDIIDCRSF